ncbi:hypothetical protein RHS01_05729 [Rhizoctonia solani]|uniref:Uncharacterized protein n=1 Tax=Rhizoctonia solani TaxID=456999 RepID=A0A8H7M4P1_9AGAM|nr:hypothetical protein RHS01_05729 [Rhizoctonia solani]
MEPTDLSLSPSCRILLVSASVDQSRELVDRLGPFMTNLPTPNPNDESYIEWTIKNKYYTAPVHLYLHQVSKPPAKPLWPPEADDERVPALIFVFRKDEPYRELFLSMKEAYLAHDAEVALAVSLPTVSSRTKNFEYVDTDDSPDAKGYSDHLQHAKDVRGVPRILEALNMIMWPSMVRTATGGLRRTVVDAGEQGEPPSIAFEHSFATISDTAPRITPELNAWLDDAGSWTPGNRGERTTVTAESQNEAVRSGEGFDDDFTDFLSAPPETNSEEDLPSSADVGAITERIFGQDSDAPGGFDLSSVLGALETMRLEIGAITDIEERRKAAARVALGLAAGLGIDGRDGSGDEFDEELLHELNQIK